MCICVCLFESPALNKSKVCYTAEEFLDFVRKPTASSSTVGFWT